MFSPHTPKAQSAELMLRSLPARTQGAGITFFVRDARSAYKGIPRSAVIVHAVSPSPEGISHPSSQWSPEQFYLVRLLLTYLLHNSNTREEGGDKEGVFPPTPPPVKQHTLNVPMAIILAQSIFSPLCKAEAGRQCSYTQPTAACSSQHPCPQQAIRCCTSANSHPSPTTPSSSQVL